MSGDIDVRCVAGDGPEPSNVGSKAEPLVADNHRSTTEGQNMGHSKRKRSRVKRASAKTRPRSQGKRAGRNKKWTRLALVLGTLLVAAAASTVIWSESQPSEAALAAGNGYEVSGDVVYVNNRECAMSDSPIAEKDLGRFESRVTYDGPIERFQGKTLVFNQCCANCIESFPKKWVAERDQIMHKFGLAQGQLE